MTLFLSVINPTAKPLISVFYLLKQQKQPIKCEAVNPNPILQGGIKTEVAYDHSFQPLPCGFTKKYKKLKASRPAKSGNHESNAGNTIEHLLFAITYINFSDFKI